MKSVIKRSSVAVWLVALFYATSGYAGVQSHALPEWMIDQSDLENCAVGAAAADTLNPVDVAMYAGALELGMTRLVKVDGVEKQYSEKSVIKNVKQLNRVTRLLAETYREKMAEAKNWKSASGDYFSLVCKDDKGQALKPVAGIIKSFYEQNELNTSAKINQSVMLTINSQTSLDTVDEFSYVGNKSRWLDDVLNEARSLEVDFNSEASEEFINVTVADVRVREGRLSQAYVQLLAQSRHALANKLKARVRAVLKQNAATDKNQSVVSEVLKNTLVEKVYYDKIEGSVYMIMSHRFTRQDIDKVAERKIKPEKHQASIQ